MTENGQWQKSRKDASTSQSDVFFVVMDALVHVLVNEILIPHCHLNGDCQEPDDRHPERSLTNGHEDRKVP